MTEREALKLALEALEEAADAIGSWGSYASGYFQVKHDLEGDISKAKSAITAIKEALANVATNDTSQERVDKTSESVHEPEYLAFMDTPQRNPLTRKEVLAIIDKHPAEKKTGLPMFYRDQVLGIARAIEAAHGIKGEA